MPPKTDLEIVEERIASFKKTIATTTLSVGHLKHYERMIAEHEDKRDKLISRREQEK